MRRRLAYLVAFSMIAVSIPLVAGAQTDELPGDCTIDEGTTVRVLLLIDQSGSLTRTDPDNRRIAGAEAVVRSYTSLADRVEQVEIQVAGFGEDYAAGEWSALNQESLGTVLERVETVASVNDQPHTDYVYALDGASEAFGGSTADCQILFWFTDGEHDLDSDLLPASGLERFYFEDGPVTPANVDQVEAMMPGLVCDLGGYADRLGDAGVSSQIMLLGDEGGMDEASRRVLRGMGGDPDFDCGPGNGSFQSVDDAARLPFLMACAAQVGSYQLPAIAPSDARVVITEQTVDAGSVPYQLATELRLITWSGGGATPALASTTLTDVTETGNAASGVSAVTAQLVGEPFSLEMSNVVEACGFVTAVAATPVIQSVSPALYQNEPGEFLVVADGPHGRVEGAALGRIEVASESGQVEPANELGWTITVPTLPAEADYQLTVDLLSAPGLSATATGTFTLNEQINAPVVVEQPAPISGEGVGPFLVDLQVDPRDGGELCLLTSTGTLTAAEDEAAITASADLEGSECVQVEPGGTRTVTMGITLDRSGFAHGVLEFQTRSTPDPLPDRSEEGLLAVDLEVTPMANPVLVTMIVLGLMLLMLGLLWAIVYGVNRLIGRIPDPRRNRIRHANFVAEMTATEYGEVEMGIAEMPVDSEFRIPRRTPARLDAGRLRIERTVSVFPWIAPHAEIGVGTDLLAAHQGPGVPGRTVFAERSFRGRARDALGPLVVIGLTSSQMDRLAEGTPQKVPGVLLFDIRAARGSDASRFAADMINDALQLIAAEISTRQLLDNLERTAET
jgi:hypothetical protein